MLRLSKLTDYAVVVLLRLGSGEGGTQTTPGLATATSIPEPTVAKVLKSLGASGLVASYRGARGGYSLSRPLHAVSIADVIEAIDGPIALTACVEGSTTFCDVRGTCAVRGRWELVNDAIYRALTTITLADLKNASVPPDWRVPRTAASVDHVAAE